MKKRIVSLLLVCLTVLTVFSSCQKYMEGFVPSGYQKASSDLVPYFLYVPSDWTVLQSGEVITASTKGANISMTSVEPGDAIAVESGEDVTPLDKYWNTYREQLVSALGNVEFLKEGEAMLVDGTVGAKKYVYAAKVGGVDTKFMQMLCLKKGTMYIFTFTCESEQYDTLVEQAEGILSYFSFEVPLTDQEK